MQVKNVKRGDVLELKRWSYIDSDNRIERWTVTEIYNNFVLCERNGIRECFTVGELVCLGYEPHNVTNDLKKKKYCPRIFW